MAELLLGEVFFPSGPPDRYSKTNLGCIWEAHFSILKALPPCGSTESNRSFIDSNRIMALREQEREISSADWTERSKVGWRHFLNVTPSKMTVEEFLSIIALANDIAGDESDVALGAFFDDEHNRPDDDHRDVGIYVKRPSGWTPL